MGDEVLSFSTKDRVYVFDRIVYIHDHSKETGSNQREDGAIFYKLYLRDLEGNLKIIKVTGDHYIYYKGCDQN